MKSENDASKKDNLLTTTMNGFAGPVHQVGIALIIGILLSYAFFYVSYFIGVIEKPPTLIYLAPILSGQFILVSFALWLKKKHPK